MKYALVNGQREIASAGSSAFCPLCEKSMIAKCGDVKVHHWAHKIGSDCDHWSESETPWHRNWKNHFPEEWQEDVQHADDGEKHIADVKTDQGWVLEFQHSRIDPKEQRAREAFYRKMIWIVDGTRRKTDQKRFRKMLRDDSEEIVSREMWRIFRYEGCPLIKEWAECRYPIFFDFAGEDMENKSSLRCLLRLRTNMLYICTFPRQVLIACHQPNTDSDFLSRMKNLYEAASIFSQDEDLTYGPHAAVLRKAKQRYN